MNIVYSMYAGRCHDGVLPCLHKHSTETFLLKPSVQNFPKILKKSIITTNAYLSLFNTLTTLTTYSFYDSDAVRQGLNKNIPILEIYLSYNLYTIMQCTILTKLFYV